MIPSIEEIIGNLLAGDITQSQAIEWLHQHVASAYAIQDKSVLRDQFAGLAMQAVIAHPHGMAGNWDRAAIDAYKAADAMIAERSKS